MLSEGLKPPRLRNLNNHVGCRCPCCACGPGPVAVLEMGMNHAGEIRRWRRYWPNVGVVTNRIRAWKASIRSRSRRCEAGIDRGAAARRSPCESDDRRAAAFAESIGSRGDIWRIARRDRPGRRRPFSKTALHSAWASSKAAPGRHSFRICWPASRWRDFWNRSERLRERVRTMHPAKCVAALISF
jgi:hypothetical protein